MGASAAWAAPTSACPSGSTDPGCETAQRRAACKDIAWDSSESIAKGVVSGGMAAGVASALATAAEGSALAAAAAAGGGAAAVAAPLLAGAAAGYVAVKAQSGSYESR